MSVLLGHFLANSFPDAGPIGVEMFFVLSGRLMAEMLFVRRVRLRAFLWRRTTRIMPGLLLFVVTVTALVNVARLGHFMYVRPTAAATAALLVYNFTTGPGGLYPPIDNLWSLCVEEHSYLLLAGIALLARRGFEPRILLLLGALLSVGDWVTRTVLFGQGFIEAGWRTDAHVASILLSAWLFLTIGDRRRRCPQWVAPGFAMLGIAMFNHRVPVALWLTVGTACFAIAVNTLDDTHPAALRMLGSPALTGLARRSYSIYLWQQPFFVLSAWQLDAGPITATFFVGAAMLVGSMAYLFEVRSRERLNEPWRRPCRADRQEVSDGGRHRVLRGDPSSMAWHLPRLTERGHGQATPGSTCVLRPTTAASAGDPAFGGAPASSLT